MRASYESEVDLQCAAWMDVRCDECCSRGSMIRNEERLQQISVELYRREWERIWKSLSYAVKDLKRASEKSKIVEDVTYGLIRDYERLMAKIEKTVDMDYVSEEEELNGLLKQLQKKIEGVEDYL
jgi:DNA polymerase II small subunit/DNA polymerase delta subunit B